MVEKDERERQREREREREEEEEEDIEDVTVFHGECTLYLCTSNPVHCRLAICLLINQALQSVRGTEILCVFVCLRAHNVC